MLRALVCSLLFIGGSAAAGAEPVLLFQGGSARDVASSPAGDRLYIALYSTDEVIALDTASGAELHRVRVGHGPASLVAAGDAIAVLNRSSASISILNAVDLSLRATVSGISSGTNDIAFAGPDRIVALDPFDAWITLIDLTTGAILASAQAQGTMPVDAAYAGGSLLVASRTPAILMRLDAASLAESRRTLFGGELRGLAACGGSRVAVTSGESLSLIDPETMQVIRTIPVAANTVASAPDGIVCVTGSEVHMLTADLAPGVFTALPAEVRGARATPQGVVAWSPELGRVWRLDDLTAGTMSQVESEPATDRVAIAAVSTDATVEAHVPIDAAPIAEADPPTAPQVATHSPSQVTADATFGHPLVPSPVIVAQEIVDEPDAVPYHLTIRPSRPGLGGPRPYAPRFGDPTGRTIREELDRALDVAADNSSLTQIDFSQPPQNLKGGFRITNTGDKETIEVGPNADFVIDDVHVRTDRLTYTDKPQELVLDGNVELQRGESTLTADHIRAFNVQPIKLTGRPLVPSNREKAIPHPLVPRGYKPPDPDSGPPLGLIEMDNIHWIEPGRELEAKQLRTNSLARNADLQEPHGQAGPVYFGAERLQMLGPENVLGTDFWVTTCDDPVPHYRLRLSRVETQDGEAIKGSHARLQLGQTNTPFYVPRLTASLLPGERRLRTELKVGRASDIGNFLNVAQWLRLTENIDVAPRLYVTTQQGTGFGFDSEYNFMNDPASALFRSEGKLQTLYTTEDSGYTHWYHRQEFTPDTVLLGQWEQWYDQGFYKDFYNDEYENRTGPRTFASVIHTRPQWLASGTVAKATNDFTAETEKLPELSFQLFERRLAGGFYGTFDTVGGFYETQPDTIDTLREVTVGRLSYDWNVARGFNVLPFVEMDATYYAKTLDDERDALRGSVTMGVTAQARLQRSFPGIGNFTGFKHLIIPSVTLMYRPDTTLDAEDTPRFDDYDDRPGRFRLESTIDNILLGRNGPTGQIWPVARLTLYQGNDFENEAVRSNDYELELEIRPRPTWGLQAVGEVHDLDEDDDLPGDDFNRVLTYLFYDNKLSKNSVNGRIGFAYTESANDVLNQEILYGVGYRVTNKWSVAFEQRYDFERDELTRQTYSIRRKFHDWEVGLSLRDKETGVDIGIEINLVDFPEIGLGL